MRIATILLSVFASIVALGGTASADCLWRDGGFKATTFLGREWPKNCGPFKSKIIGHQQSYISGDNRISIETVLFIDSGCFSALALKLRSLKRTQKLLQCGPNKSYDYFFERTGDRGPVLIFYFRGSEEQFNRSF